MFTKKLDIPQNLLNEVQKIMAQDQVVNPILVEAAKNAAEEYSKMPILDVKKSILNKHFNKAISEMNVGYDLNLLNQFMHEVDKQLLSRKGN